MVEDTPTSCEDVAANFGERVAKIVRENSDHLPGTDIALGLKDKSARRLNTSLQLLELPEHNRTERQATVASQAPTVIVFDN